MKTFSEFVAFMKQKESTAAKRAKTASLLGLAAPIAEPSIHSGATANPRYLDYYEKHVKNKKTKTKKSKKKKGKKMNESFDKPTPPINHGVDKWLDSVDKLKKGLKHPTDDLPDDEEDKVPDDLDRGDDHPIDEPFDGEDEDEGGDEGDFGDEGGDEGDEGDFGDEGDEGEPSLDEPPPDKAGPPGPGGMSGKPPFGKFAASKTVPSFREWVQHREKQR